MPLLGKFSRSQTPPVKDLSSPADIDRFRSSKPPTSGTRAATQPTTFTPSPYIPSAPPGVGSQPRRSSKTASKFGLHQLPLPSARTRAQSQGTPIPIQPVHPSNARPLFANRPSEHLAVEVTPAVASSGLRNMFTRSHTPQPQHSQPISSVSNNKPLDLESVESPSRSKKERETHRASRSGIGSGAGPPPPPPGKDDPASIPLQKGEKSSQMRVNATDTAAPQRKRTGSAWGSYLMPTPKLPASGPPISSERRERATPNTDARLETHPQTIPLRSKQSSRDLQSLYERSKTSLPMAIPKAQPVSLSIPSQPKHGSQTLGLQSQAASLAPASRAPREIRETKSSKVLHIDRSSADHPHPSVVEVISPRSSRNTMTTTYMTAQSSEAQAVPLASAPAHHKYSYASPLNVSTEYTQSSPGGESLLTPSSLATSYPLPWEASAPLHQQSQLFSTSKPLPPIVRSPVPPPVLLPLAEPRSEETTGNESKAPQDKKHEVKLDAQIKLPSPPPTLNASSSSSSPSLHGSSPASSFHSIQPIVESGEPSTSGGRPPVVTLHSSEKSSEASQSRTSSSASIMAQSPGGLAKPRVTPVSVSPPTFVHASLGSAPVQEASPARVSPVQSPTVISPPIDTRGFTSPPSVPPPSSYPAPALETTPGISLARLSPLMSLPAATIPSVLMSPPITTARPIVASPPIVASGLPRPRVRPSSIPLPTSTPASPSPAPALEPTPTLVRVSPVQSPTTVALELASPVATSPMMASPPTTSSGLAKARLPPSSTSLPMFIPSTSGPAPTPEPNIAPAQVSSVQSPAPVSPSMAMSPVTMSPPIVASPPPASSGLAKYRVPTASSSLQRSTVPSDPAPAPTRIYPTLSPAVVSPPPMMMSPPAVASPSALPPWSPVAGSRALTGTIDRFENALELVLPSIGHAPTAVSPAERVPDHPLPVSEITAAYPVQPPDADPLWNTELPTSSGALEPEASIGTVPSIAPPIRPSDVSLAPRDNLVQSLSAQKSLPSLPVLSPRQTPTTALSAFTPAPVGTDPASTLQELPHSPTVTEVHAQSPPVRVMKSNLLDATAPTSPVVLPVATPMLDRTEANISPLQSPRPSYNLQSGTPMGTVSSPSHVTFSQPLADSLFQVLSAGGVIGPAPSSARDPSLALESTSLPAQSPPNETKSVPPPIPTRSPERRPSVPSRPSSPVPPRSPPLALSPRPSYLQSPTLSSRSPQVISAPMIHRPMSPTPKNMAPPVLSRPSTARAEAAPVPPSRPSTPTSAQANRPTSPVPPRPFSPPVIRSSSTPNLGENQPTAARKEQTASFRFWKSSRSHSPAHLNVLSPPPTPSIDVTPPIRPPTPMFSRSYNQTFASYSLPASTRSSAQSLRDLAVPPRENKQSIEASPQSSPHIRAQFVASTIPLSKKAAPLAFLNRRKHVRTLSSASMEAIGSRSQTLVGSVADGFSSRGFSEFSPPPSPEPVESLVKDWFEALAAVPQTLKVRKPGVTWEVDHTSSPVASMPVLMARDEWVPFPQIGD